MTDDDILTLWTPPLPGTVQRPILGRNEIIAFGRAVADAASAQERARAERMAGLLRRALPLIRAMDPARTVQTLSMWEMIAASDITREIDAALAAEEPPK